MDLRSNDSRRYSQSSNSGSSGPGVKSKWIKAFRSLKLTAVGGGSRNNDLADLEAQRAYRISVQLGVHAFQEYTYKKITACDVCREILRGHSRQGLKCKLCKMNVHPGQCQENAPKCQPKPRLLRKQKSASELETKITIPQIDDEKYQNYEVYQSLQGSADARRSAQYIQDHYSSSPSSSSAHHQQPLIIQQDSFGSSGSISTITQTQNNKSKQRIQEQQQTTGSNDSLGSNGSQHQQHHVTQSSSSSSRPSKEISSQSCPQAILMQHRNSDSEFHPSFHRQMQQFQQQHPSELTNHTSSRYHYDHEPMNGRGYGNPNHHQLSHNNGPGNNGNGIMKKHSASAINASPALLQIAQSTQQPYSAPHSPQRKKLTLRMKSLSLDSPESVETLKDKRMGTNMFAAAVSSGSHHGVSTTQMMEQQQQMMMQMMQPNPEPPPIPSTLPPVSGGLPKVGVGQSPPRYDSAEMINCYPYKTSIHHSPQQQQQQITKRFKLGIHGRMRSFERDDPITIHDLPPCSMSPCPSPKPQRLLPTNIFVVLYNFRSRQVDELNLRAGYMVTVVDTTDPDWWQGKCMGKVGYFPSKYVTKLFPGERPLQVIHTVQLTDGEFAIKLLREQIVIQVSEEMNGIIMVRTGINDKIVPCPAKYLQEITY